MHIKDAFYIIIGYWVCWVPLQWPTAMSASLARGTVSSGSTDSAVHTLSPKIAAWQKNALERAGQVEHAFAPDATAPRGEQKLPQAVPALQEFILK